ncbi:hypothetical protein ATANTOWER_003063 [Ataeniobius toweri]|uniref:Uncharacterized protein n=1 Tax=Ataeniobius toweri TaxID=208326 RepID=A0ABU7C220_9TELE|nr:hypothetical protein [Ataeniobius toweri]
MPIASGASGRVDVGVDTSKRWAPNGVRVQPVIHQYGSYLLRYHELNKLEKKNISESMQGGKSLTDLKNDGVKEEMTKKNNSEDNISGKSSREKTSETSMLCVIL